MFYGLLFVLLFVFINGYFKLADHYNIIDKPNKRSSHTAVTIRGGGVIFTVGAIAWFVWSGFMFPYFMLGLILISIISFADDVKPIPNRLRLLVHFAAALLLFYQLNMWGLPWWAWLIALVVTTGIINAFNFMDGINGITGGYSLAVLFGLWLVNNFQFGFIDNQFMYCIAIALLVFNFYNFRGKAKCFAGDVGSVSIAFILIFLLGKLILGSGNIIYIFFLTLYGVDSVLTIVHRIYLKENIFEAHRKHAYQVMANEGKISHQKISVAYAIIQALINGFIVLLIDRLPNGNVAGCIFLLLVLLTAIYIMVKRKFYSLQITGG